MLWKTTPSATNLLWCVFLVLKGERSVSPPKDMYGETSGEEWKNKNLFPAKNCTS